jgi:hypothetical protein
VRIERETGPSKRWEVEVEALVVISLLMLFAGGGTVLLSPLRAVLGI